MQFKNFQHHAVDKLVLSARGLFRRSASSVCVLKAPTGSGKTIMMAEFLKRLTFEDLGNENGYVFIWIAPRKLHLQSKTKLDSYLHHSIYSLITIEDMSAEALPANSILFTNWEQLTNTDKSTGEWTNVYVRDREDGRSIPDVLAKTREAGRHIVLIIDEAHLHSANDKNNARRLVDEEIRPLVTFEVSATPQTDIPPEDIVDKKAGYVKVQFEDVIAEGLIKQETVINASVEQYTDFSGSADDVVLTAALARRNALVRIYQEAGIAVNPLMLVQLPNNSKSMNALDNQVKTDVETFLAEKNITYENGKLAVMLSEEKSEALFGIDRNDNPVEVLIFKTAIATGWDCPRAQIMVMLRPMGSITFEIQTVGRILRMPEAVHYDEPDLNRAFIYTNISTLAVRDEKESLDFFKNKPARLKKGIENVTLPSVFLHRTDYGDLMQKFEDVLIEVLDDRFGITEAEWWQHGTLQKVKEKKLLEWDSEKLKQPVVSNLVLQNIDKIAEEMENAFVEKVLLTVSAKNIQREFDYLSRLWSHPYAPSRSYAKIKQGIYRWFEHLGYAHYRWGEVRRMTACSAVNQEFFMECIKAAKDKYAAVRHEEIQSKRQRTSVDFSLPAADDFGENYEHFQADKYAYGRCYLRKDRPDTEREFEKRIDASDAVEWWYKNGEKSCKYFAIAYEINAPETALPVLRAFYPDYIVRWRDGSIGIYDTKGGFTAAQSEAGVKSDALQEYVRERQHGCRLVGGILQKRSGGWYLFDAAEYSEDMAQWRRFEFRS